MADPQFNILLIDSNPYCIQHIWKSLIKKFQETLTEEESNLDSIKIEGNSYTDKYRSITYYRYDTKQDIEQNIEEIKRFGREKNIIWINRNLSKTKLSENKVKQVGDTICGEDVLCQLAASGYINKETTVQLGVYSFYSELSEKEIREKTSRNDVLKKLDHKLFVFEASSTFFSYEATDRLRCENGTEFGTEKTYERYGIFLASVLFDLYDKHVNSQALEERYSFFKKDSTENLEYLNVLNRNINNNGINIGLVSFSIKTEGNKEHFLLDIPYKEYYKEYDKHIAKENIFKTILEDDDSFIRFSYRYKYDNECAFKYKLDSTKRNNRFDKKAKQYLPFLHSAVFYSPEFFTNLDFFEGNPPKVFCEEVVNENFQADIEIHYFIYKYEIEEKYKSTGHLHFALWRECSGENTGIEDIKKIEKILYPLIQSRVTSQILPLIISDLERHAIEAAIAQVMARNISHNIGSHVLNNLTNGTNLTKIGDFQCCSYVPNKEWKNLKEEGVIIHQLAIYNNYVKCRMDYLSDITFGTPVMHSNKKVYGELYRDLDKVRLLLEYISGLSDDFRYRIEFAIDDESIKDDFYIALPNDLLGCQAFYNIIENVIRNTAKHNQNKDNKKETVFTINFKDISCTEYKGADKDLLYEVEIYDDIPIKDIDDLVKSQNEKINLSVLDEESNQLRTSSLGVLEMKASATYLRKLEIVNVQDDKVEHNVDIYNKQHKLNILKAFNKNGALGYRFFVNKPTEFLFVVDFNLQESRLKTLAKMGVWIISKEKFVQELKTLNTVFNHQFLIYQDNDLLPIISDYSTNLPIRQLHISTTSMVEKILKASPDLKNVEDWVWNEWFGRNNQGYETVNICTTFSDTNNEHTASNAYNIAFSHHVKEKTIESCKENFYKGNIKSFDIMPSNAINRLPEMKDIFTDYIEYISNIQTLKLKFFEASINNVTVLDERVQQYCKDFYLKISNKEIFDFINVKIPKDIKLAATNYTADVIRKIEDFIENSIEDNKCKFLLVHYSILERMFESEKEKINEVLIKWAKTTRVVVTSGRGKPSGLPSSKVCFIHLSPILNVFTQAKSKYAINDLLSNARR